MSRPLDLIRAKSVQARARILAVVADLNDEQLSWRPTPRAHSIGFTIWHTARANDNVQGDLTGAELEWVTGGYAARWGHPERGVGTGWDDERAAALPLPSKDPLVEYVRRVFERVDAAVSDLDETVFAQGIRSRFMGGDSTFGEVVLVCMSHDNRHLGEIEYIKGLLGLKRSVTT